MSQPNIADVMLTPKQKEFTDKLMSSEGFAAQIVDRIKRKLPTSVARFSDGERGFIKHGQGGAREWFMNTEDWLKRYGVEGANLAKIGRDVLLAGQRADYVGIPLAGVYWPCFDTFSLFPERKRFVDHYYPLIWEACGYVGAILSVGRVFVLHREFEAVLSDLRAKYGIRADSSGMRLDSWRDHECILDTLPAHPGDIVLVSGGPSGKLLCVNLAQKTGAVVLDVGEAMGACWATDAKNHLERSLENRGHI